MKFDTSALKAWVGALLTGAADAASHGGGLGGFAVSTIESIFKFDLPVSIEGYIYTAVGAAIGYAAVYFTSNDYTVVKAVK